MSVPVLQIEQVNKRIIYPVAISTNPVPSNTTLFYSKIRLNGILFVIFIHLHLIHKEKTQPSKEKEPG